MKCDSLKDFRSATLARVHRSGRYCAALLVFLLAGAFYAFAQEATIVETVTDPTGSVVPNVAITITNTDTGLVRTLATNVDGQYVAPDLRIGHHKTQ